MTETMPMTPQELADAVSDHMHGHVVAAAISETLDGWYAGVTVEPFDPLRRAVAFSEGGATRDDACAALIQAADSWAQAFAIPSRHH